MKYKLLFTFLISYLGAFSQSDKTDINYGTVNIGRQNSASTNTISLRGKTYNHYLSNGSGTDSVLTVQNGRFMKVPRSQFNVDVSNFVTLNAFQQINANKLWNGLQTFIAGVTIVGNGSQVPRFSDQAIDFYSSSNGFRLRISAPYSTSFNEGLTANRDVIFQNKSGTVALMEDIQVNNTVSSLSSLSLITGGYYTFTGSSGNWQLPALAGNTGKRFLIMNQGSGMLTVLADTGTDIYNGSNVGSVTINVGEIVVLYNNSISWFKQL